ncbi:MAG: DUF1499 domain-containing protein [Nitrospirota bacterium]
MVKITMAVVAGVVALVVAVFALRAWPLINVVETGRTPEYPDITPRAYRMSPDRVFDAALHAVHRLPRWSLVSYRPETGEIRTEARTLVFRFVDDVEIRISTLGESSVVGVKSASRVGRGDFGQNARNIRAFFVELDRQLGSTSNHD